MAALWGKEDEAVGEVGKWTLNQDVFLIEHGDIPASYVRNTRGYCESFRTKMSLFLLRWLLCLFEDM